MPGDVTSQESRRPEGTVLSQEPQAGAKAAIGTAVSLVVARPVTVLVPSLAGRTQAAANELLKKAELIPGEVSSESPAGARAPCCRRTPPRNSASSSAPAWTSSWPGR